MRWIDSTEFIRRISRNWIAAIRAVAHTDINGHAARRAADMAAVVTISRYSARPEAHGRFLSLCARSSRFAVGSADTPYPLLST